MSHVCEIAPQLSPCWADPKLLVLDAGQALRALSWALGSEGFSEASRVAWCEFDNTELGLEVDPLQLVQARLQRASLSSAVAFLTSARVALFGQVRVSVDGIEVEACATAGLSNAECVGERRVVNAVAAPDPAPQSKLGTINLACFISVPVSLGAQCEALSIAVEARTRAVLEANILLDGGPLRATGTGTDCVAILAPNATSTEAAPFAGKHTALGVAIGAACYRAVARAIGNLPSKAGQARLGPEHAAP